MDFLKLCTYFEQILATSKRLEKTKLIAKLLKETPDKSMEQIVLLLRGRVFPVWDNRKLGVSSRQIISTIKSISGDSIETIEREWKKTGDLGITAQNLLKDKKQKTLFQTNYSLNEIFKNIVKLAETTGQNSTKLKQGIVSNLFSNVSGVEAKYLCRILLENLQIGIGPGTLRESIIWAFLPQIYSINYSLEKDFVKENKKDNQAMIAELEKSKLKVIEINSIEEFGSQYMNENSDVIFYSKDEALLRQIYNYYSEKIEYYYQLTNQYSQIIQIIKETGFSHLDDIKLEPGTPIQVMLTLKAKNIEHALENVGSPAAFEYKYDGFRIQAHRNGKLIKLFTRRLEDVTAAFPDLVESIEKRIQCDNFIIDCEVVGVDKQDPNKILPFQEISKRIKRKHDIQAIIKELPVRLNVFDIMEKDGENLLNTPFEQRRKIIESMIEDSEHTQISKMIISSDVKEIEQFYNEALNSGNEGLMAKSLNGIYKPGNRVGHQMKIKPTMEPLDLVIIGATWGEGKRSNSLTSFNLAIRDENSDLLEIGKVGTGFKELDEVEDDVNVSFSKMTKLLKPNIVEEKGKEIRVNPTVVIEVSYEEIQKSSNYNSGYALRFPRFSRLKTDRTVDDISTLSFVEDLFNQQ